MTDIAIRVENLSKCYPIGQREPYLALRDIIANTAKAPFRYLKGAGDGCPILSPRSSVPRLRSVKGYAEGWGQAGL